MNTLSLEEFEYAVTSRLKRRGVPKTNIKAILDVWADEFVGTLRVVTVGNVVHQENRVVLRRPRTFWDTWKAALLPTFLVRLLPVQYETLLEEVKFIHVCPHMRFPSREAHLSFLVPSEGQEED